MSPARRAAGEGTIFFDSSRNRWVGQLPARPGPGGKRRRGRKVSGKTRKEVAAKLAEIQRDQHLDRRTQTLRQYLRWFCDEHLPGEDMKPQTIVSYRQNLVAHVTALAGHMRVADIDADDAADIKRWLGAMVARGELSDSTVRLIWTQLAHALDTAEARGWLATNWVRKVKPPKVARKEKPILDVDQARALMDAFAGDEFEVLLLTYVLTGARVAEPLALAWDDVDLDAGMLTIGWQLIRRDGVWHREPLKKREAGESRIIPLAPRLATALRDHRRAQLAARVASPAWDNEWDLVFTGSHGEPVWPVYVRRALAVAVHRAFGPDAPKITPHRLRAGAASFLLAEHVPMPVVMAILGHRSSAVLLDVYAQSLGVSMDEAREALERLGGA